MGIVTQTQRSKGAQKFFNWIRRKENTTLIPKKASKKIMMDVLDNNKFLGLASDQNAGKNGVNVPFFNSKVSKTCCFSKIVAFKCDAMLSEIFEGSFKSLILLIVSLEIFLLIEVSFSNFFIEFKAKGIKSSPSLITSFNLS